MSVEVGGESEVTNYDKDLFSRDEKINDAALKKVYLN